MIIGDVFEIETKKGKGYIQLVSLPFDNTEVEKIRVFYNLYYFTPKNIRVILEEDYFYLEFALKAAIKKKIVTHVGNIMLEENFEYPQFFRTENVFGEGWRIINSEGGQKTVDKLSAEQRKMSPWGVWNDTLLISNLENGWRLENWEV